MASLSAIPKWQVMDGNGIPLSGAKLESYVVGTDTPKDTYTAYNSTTPAAWPLVFDSEGRSEVWLGSGLYKMVLKNSADDVIWTVDGVSSGGGGGAGGASVDTVIGATDSIMALAPAFSTFVSAGGYRTKGDEGGGNFYWDANSTASDGGTYIKPASLAIGDPGRWIRLQSGNINVRTYGCYGSVGNDDYTFMALAISYAAANGKAIYLPKGTYDLSTDPGFAFSVPVVFDPKAILRWTSLVLPAIEPVIGVDDYTQHFDVPADKPPKFPAGSLSIPQWFGAVANATADDQAAVHAAHGAVCTYGGNLYFPTGTYWCSTQIIIQDNVTIFGDGAASIIKAKSSTPGEAIFSHATATSVINKWTLKDLTLDGDGTNLHGVYANLKNSQIENVTFSNLRYNDIWLAGAHGDASNIKIINNNLSKTGIGSGYYGGILIWNGDNITISGNEYVNSTATQGSFFVGATALPTGQPIANLTIIDNKANDIIELIPAPASSQPINNTIIEGNKISPTASTTSISHEFAKGACKISDNEVSVYSTGIGIYVHAPVGAGSGIPPSLDQASYYQIDNNSVYGDKMTGIDIAGIGVPMSVVGNNIFSATATTTPAIYSVCDGTRIHLEANTFHNYGDTHKYSTPSPLRHVCYLADSFDSTVGGDSSAHHNLNVAQNLTVGGTIINPAMSSLFQSMISGLDMTRASNTALTVNPGTASTDGTYLTTLTTAWTKKIDGNFTPGNSASYGGMASAVTLAAYTWYHVFLLGNTVNASADIGFDDNYLATNLMTDAASAGFIYKRRIGCIYYTAGLIQGFQQHGDEFSIGSEGGGFGSSDIEQTNAGEYTHQLNLPRGFKVKAHLAASMYPHGTENHVMIGEINCQGPSYAVLADANIEVGGGSYMDVWTDTQSTIAYKFIKGASNPLDLWIYTLGYTDGRGKY